MKKMEITVVIPTYWARRGAEGWREENQLEKVKWLLELGKEGLVEIRLTKKVRHWMIVDGVHFRLEKAHPEDETGRKNLIFWTFSCHSYDL
ncbi:MAG: hypothetical protein ACXQTS_01220 [Candidatus Methanospirareceae archaeon]